MTGWRLKPRTLFGLVVFAALAASLVAGIWLAYPLVAGLRPGVAALAGLLGLVEDISADATGGWTAEVIARAGSMAGSATIQLEPPMLRLMLRGFPIFVALMAAPPWTGRSPARALAGLVVLFALAHVSALAAINNLTAPVPQLLASVTSSDLGASGAVIAPDGFGVFAASLLNYLFVIVAPLIAPVILWSILKPEGVRFLFGVAPARRLPRKSDAP